MLTYEVTAPPPVYPTLLHSGRLWPDEPDVRPSQHALTVPHLPLTEPLSGAPSRSRAHP